MIKTEYAADELLALSGIQHFSFCRRQWALIHVERQWHENALTAEGRALHGRTDDPFSGEVRGGVIIARALPVASYRLGVYGVCDVVEFTPAGDKNSPDGVNLRGRPGLYLPRPVEYKRGKEKQDACDEVQLCAQALCLEEMFLTTIPRGDLFYGQTRRRVEVTFTPDLRGLVERLAAEMHDLFARGHTPRVKASKACQSCSLAGLCLPRLQNRLSASKYIQQTIDEDCG
jgi:CRISPR-associated exonuclease Cas4